MLDTTSCHHDAELAVSALRYAAGAMPPAEAEAFETRLADDQSARDALAEAVRLSAAASGAPAPTPDPLVRRAVAERLHPTWLSRLFPRRPYRGHPAVWAVLGGGIAAAVAVTLTLGVNWRGEPTFAHAPTILPVAITAADAPTPAEPQLLQKVAPEKPIPTRLNPMGMDKRVADTTPVGPSPVVVPPPAVVPMLMPAAKPTDDKVAEGLNEPIPMGDPAVGMMMSKL